MKSVVLEIRNKGRWIAVLAADLSPENAAPKILVMRLNKLSARDSNKFPGAVDYIIQNWAALKDSDVIDVNSIGGVK